MANEKVKENIIEIQTEKYERRLSEEISKLRIEFYERISKLEANVARMYANIIKWMFIFWVGQIGVITAILFSFLKFIR